MLGCGGGPPGWRGGEAEPSPTLPAFLPPPRPQLSPGSEEDEAHEGCSRENLGRIQFSVGYNFQESTLTVKIMKAQELPAKDFSGTSDPFVKIYLLPDKKHKLETKVKRKNLNPHWNETFLFEGEAGATPAPTQSPAFPSSMPPTQGHMYAPVRTHVRMRRCARMYVRTGAHAHARTRLLALAHTGACLSPANVRRFASSWDEVTGPPGAGPEPETEEPSAAGTWDLSSDAGLVLRRVARRAGGRGAGGGGPGPRGGPRE